LKKLAEDAKALPGIIKDEVKGKPMMESAMKMK